MNSRPKTCAITGGSSGIGLATAIRFARDGWAVSICARNPQRLNQADLQIKQAVPAAVTLAQPLDIRDRQQAECFVERTNEHFESVDVLVNNAGTATLSPLVNMSSEDFEAMIDLNVRGVFYLTRAAYRVMQGQGGGVVVNVSSLAALDPFPGLGLYGASKAWLDLVTKSLANEGRDLGIRAYSIRPGAVETPLLRSLFPDFPAGQTVSPEEIAEAIYSVCQPPWANSSGEAIAVHRQ